MSSSIHRSGSDPEYTECGTMGEQGTAVCKISNLIKETWKGTKI